MNLFIGAILGFISVVFGAYAEHGLKAQLPAQYFDFLMTAVRYNQLYAIIISGIGIAFLASQKLADSIVLKITNLFFILGLVLFSFSIYIFVLFNTPAVLRLTPLGGSILMLGWFSLAISGLTLTKKK